MIQSLENTISKLFFSSIICSLLIIGCNQSPKESKQLKTMKAEVPVNKALLRHVVLFKFKEGADQAAINKAEKAFAGLKNKIPEIQGFEWGLNNSPEGLDKGFTHCYFLTFKSEEDRAVYLPHPDHKAFGGLLKDILEDVLVVDYWAK